MWQVVFQVRRVSFFGGGEGANFFLNIWGGVYTPNPFISGYAPFVALGSKFSLLLRSLFRLLNDAQGSGLTPDPKKLSISWKIPRWHNFKFFFVLFSRPMPPVLPATGCNVIGGSVAMSYYLWNRSSPIFLSLSSSSDNFFYLSKLVQKKKRHFLSHLNSKFFLAIFRDEIRPILTSVTSEGSKWGGGSGNEIYKSCPKKRRLKNNSGQRSFLIYSKRTKLVNFITYVSLKWPPCTSGNNSLTKVLQRIRSVQR